MTEESLFVAEADGLEPTEWAVGPWSPDAPERRRQST